MIPLLTNISFRRTVYLQGLVVRGSIVRDWVVRGSVVWCWVFRGSVAWGSAGESVVIRVNIIENWSCQNCASTAELCCTNTCDVTDWYLGEYFIYSLSSGHRWALSPISVISDIGLSLISELPISDWESGVRHYIGYWNKILSDILYPTPNLIQIVKVAYLIVLAFYSKGRRFEFVGRYSIYFCSSMSDIGMNSDVDIWTLPISEWRFSVRCRCRISDIVDIEIDVDAHLCFWVCLHFSESNNISIWTLTRIKFV